MHFVNARQTDTVSSLVGARNAAGVARIQIRVCPPRPSLPTTTPCSMADRDSDTDTEGSESHNATPPKIKKRKRLSKYRIEWEKEHVWLQNVRENVYKANCHRNFSISHGGLNDVKQHASGSERQRKSQGALSQFLVRQVTSQKLIW